MARTIEEYAEELYEVFKLKDDIQYNRAFLHICIELETEEKIGELIYCFNNLPGITGSKCIFAYSSKYISCYGVTCRSCHKKMPERAMKILNKPPREYRRISR